MSVPFAIVSMKASEATLNERIRSRNNAMNDASEADPTVLKKLQVGNYPLLSDELAYTVEFLNDADQSCIFATIDSWDRLETLIAL
jgi:predicted kinase